MGLVGTSRAALLWAAASGGSSGVGAGGPGRLLLAAAAAPHRLRALVTAAATTGARQPASRGYNSGGGRGGGGGGPRSQPRPGGGGGGGGRPQQRSGGRGNNNAAAPAEPRVPPLQHRRQLPPRDDYFYAESASSFEDLGLGTAVAAALRAAGCGRPSRVQELAVPRLLAGRDVVLAAETGSGKTYSYLAPIAAALLRSRDATAAATADGPSSSGGRPADREEALAAAAARNARPVALVLVPNTALAAQVIAAADALRGADGAPLLRTVTVSSRSPPPFERPDVVVTTPGALCTLLRDVGGYGWLWTADGLAEAVRHVVVDEADLLLNGGYERDLKDLLELFKVTERRQMEEAAAAQLRVSAEALRGLSRPLKLELWSGGARGLVAAGWRRPGARSSGGSSGDALDDGEVDAAVALKKQYAFVAATMPALSKEDVGSELQRRYKEAEWIAGDLLHRSKPRVAHAWVDVDSEARWAAALVGAVKGCGDYEAGRARMLVFARDVASADAVSELLRSEGVRHHVYHKAVSQEAREAALGAMFAAAEAAAADAEASTSAGSEASNSGGGGGNVVIVSTDAAARGIDLPGVTHVVQADFATNAVDFIHRIGRTARADKGGRVTSLVVPDAAVLAAALRACIEEGRPVEGCFSRNRSFNKKVRRYGEFVERGAAGPGAAARGGGE